MKFIGAVAGVLTSISALVGIVMTVRRDRVIRRAFEAGQVSAAGEAEVTESTGSKILRVGAIVAFIVLALSMAAVFLASVIQNLGSF